MPLNYVNKADEKMSSYQSLCLQAQVQLVFLQRGKRKLHICESLKGSSWVALPKRRKQKIYASLSLAGVRAHAAVGGEEGGTNQNYEVKTPRPEG